ncbi:MAG TPA: hypothetical protein VF834_24475, partial [Streptosporangiaceae bacterium]
MSEHQSAARQALLTEAAAASGVAASVGDELNYLRRYYRHVDSADLIAAGPKRVGAAAAEHADLAAERPQGRAVVRVRSGAEATLLPGRDVIDVVTDDMPFLVDTITMTLAAHEVNAELVVHPQLVVRRDVTGSLREVLHTIEGARPTDGKWLQGTDGAADQIAESWSHIEVARLAEGKGDAIAADLEKALADVRMAVDDYPKMRATALRLADELAAAAVGQTTGAGGAGTGGPGTGGEGTGGPAASGGPGRSGPPGPTGPAGPASGSAPGPGPLSGGWVIPASPSESAAEIEMLLRWLVDAHFTFLGYREYDL